MVALILASLLAAALALRRLEAARRPGDRGPCPVRPAVAVVRPVFGLDPGTEAALRSLLVPGVAECVFSLQDEADPALPLVRRLAAEPGATASVVVGPVEPGFSGKTSNLLHGVAATSAPVLVLADADAVVPPGGLQRLVEPLFDPAVGLVASVPRVRGGRGLWGRLYEAQLNAAILLQWLPLASLGRAVGVPGAAVAVRRAALEAAGGIAACGGYVVDDVRLGLAITGSGYAVRLGPVVELDAGHCRASHYRSLVERGAVLFGRTLAWPVGLLHAAVNWGYLPALLVPGWRLPALLWLLVRCAALAWADRRTGTALLLPVLDLTSVAIFALTLARGRVRWQGLDYAVDRGGRVKAPAGRRG